MGQIPRRPFPPTPLRSVRLEGGCCSSAALLDALPDKRLPPEACLQKQVSRFQSPALTHGIQPAFAADTAIHPRRGTERCCASVLQWKRARTACLVCSPIYSGGTVRAGTVLHASAAVQG